MKFFPIFAVASLFTLASAQLDNDAVLDVINRNRFQKGFSFACNNEHVARATQDYAEAVVKHLAVTGSVPPNGLTPFLLNKTENVISSSPASFYGNYNAESLVKEWAELRGEFISSTEILFGLGHVDTKSQVYKDALARSDIRGASELRFPHLYVIGLADIKDVKC